MTGIIDYGVGNLFSLSSSLKAIGEEVIISSDKKELKQADRLILPGVGAFCDAAKKLEQYNLSEFVKEIAKEKALLGICLGMQLLFEESYEFGKYKGLGILKGKAFPIKEDIKEDLKIPHIGWNELKITKKDSKLFKGINNGDFVYFVHSYYIKGCEDSLLATTDYSIPITAAVEKGNIYGCQFHPEKSGEVGLKILSNFCNKE